MENDTRQQENAAILLLIVAATLLFLFGGCSRVQYVPVREVQTRIEYRDSVRYDSVHVADSIYLRIVPDTVYQYRLRTEYRYLFRHNADTVIRRDTVQVPLPVERRLSRWEQVKMDFGGMAIGAVAIILPALLIYIVRRFRRV